jgi:O-acetyl-ADP-ribose deacetylase (regulator of RNase III)
MVCFTSGDMFELPVDIRVNTVNCVGVMGAGVALAFKTRHPAMFHAYKKACDAGEIRPGTLNIWRAPTEWIINFPTKRHWRENSKYEDVEDGLKALRTYLDSLGRSVRVALPALGCGHGGLNWARVSELIERHLATTNAEVFVFEPADSRRVLAAMTAHPTAQIRMESIMAVGAPHTRPALAPPSSFPTAPMKSFDDSRSRESELLAFRAEQALHAGHSAEARSLYAQAAELEEAVVADTDPAEPRVRGVLAISTIALWLKAKRPERVRQAGGRFLAGDFITDRHARRELEELLAVALTELLVDPEADVTP